MTSLFSSVNGAVVGATALSLAIFVAVWVLAVPSKRLPRDRRRYGVAPQTSALTQAAAMATGVIDRALTRRGEDTRGLSAALAKAGLRWTVPDLILMVGAAVLAGAAFGLVVGGPLLAVVLAVLAPAGAHTYVKMRIRSRQSDFADQLDDILQLLAGNLRAGHSLLQALDSLSHETEEPAAEEITRVVNEVRVGRDLGDALDESAARMGSDDFRWVAQAIAIHRQVGGNLSEVLDQVGRTIRERNQVRRQVKALSAEGKLSAWVLIALPFLVVLALSFLNPGYMGRLTESLIGYLMIGAASILLVIGILVMRKVVKVEF